MTGSTRKKDKKGKVLCHAYYPVEFYQSFSILNTVHILGEIIDKKLVRVKVYGLIIVSFLFETSWIV